MHILLPYASLSGNTREVARMIAARCQAGGHTTLLLDVEDPQAAEAVLQPHDRLLLGCWTDNAGRTPAEMKRFVALLRDSAGLPRPDQVAVFGTGETQWGLEYYCGAAHRLARFFGSPYPVLEIEQMPHGSAHALTIQQWTDTVLLPIETPCPC
jgi:predicted ribonucleotide reductase-associated flavodoxin